MGVIIDECAGCGREVFVVIKEDEAERGAYEWRCPDCLEDNDVLVSVIPE